MEHPRCCDSHAEPVEPTVHLLIAKRGSLAKYIHLQNRQNHVSGSSAPCKAATAPTGMAKPAPAPQHPFSIEARHFKDML